jgi:hypothetical protein
LRLGYTPDCQGSWPGHDLAHRSSVAHDLANPIPPETAITGRSRLRRHETSTPPAATKSISRVPSSKSRRRRPTPQRAAISMTGYVLSEAPRPANPLSRSPGQLLAQHAPSSQHAGPLQEENRPPIRPLPTHQQLQPHTRVIADRRCSRGRAAGPPGSWLQSM